MCELSPQYEGNVSFHKERQAFSPESFSDCSKCCEIGFITFRYKSCSHRCLYGVAPFRSVIYYMDKNAQVFPDWLNNIVLHPTNIVVIKLQQHVEAYDKLIANW